jgi:hypothetical protein
MAKTVGDAIRSSGGFSNLRPNLLLQVMWSTTQSDRQQQHPSIVRTKLSLLAESSLTLLPPDTIDIIYISWNINLFDIVLSRGLIVAAPTYVAMVRNHMCYCVYFCTPSELLTFETNITFSGLHDYLGNLLRPQHYLTTFWTVSHISSWTPPNLQRTISNLF